MRFGRHRVSMSSNTFEGKRYICSFYTRDFHQQIYTGRPDDKSTWNVTGFYNHVWIPLAFLDGGWWADACMGRIA